MMDNRTLEIVEHIKYTLKGWFDEYPGLEIVYYYDPGTDYHIVIYGGPEEVCGHDGDLIIEEGELYESLFDAYGYDVNVIIFTTGSVSPTRQTMRDTRTARPYYI